MSTALTLPDAAPNYLAQVIANNPMLAKMNEQALANLSAGAPPLISTKGTWFTIKEGGETTIITGKDGQPTSLLGCIILGVKGPLEKRFYSTAYDPKAEPGPPDCQSFDGVKPDAQCTAKQNESCAGCWANVFGSGKNAKGEPSGKACADLKKLVVFANGKNYGFYVSPGSLKAFATYVKNLSARGIPLWAVITTIGFDIETPQKLTFTYAGMLDPDKQLPKVMEMVTSKEVAEILNFNMPQADIAPRTETTAAVAEEKPKTPPPSRKKQEEKKPAESAGEQQLDLGLGDAPPASPADVVLETTATVETEGPSDADIAAALGLTM